MSKEIERTREDKCREVIDYALDTLKSIRTSIKDLGIIDRSEFYRELSVNKDLSDHYARVKEDISDALFEEIIEIADTEEEGEEVETITNGKRVTTIVRKNEKHRQRQLRIDARKWVVAKMNPKKYGNKVDVTSDGEKIQAPAILTNNPLEQNED